uniref:cystathionine gamma-lyase n=1 Tax=Arcella intermedia TaxID=1963864 RepID=A0A6B2L722_9EUKA
MCFEEAVASLENGKWGLAFSSGMAAITAITHLLNPEDELVAVDDLYGGTFRYFARIAGPKGLKFKTVDFTQKSETYLDAINNKTKLVWIETPTNPSLKIIDIAVAVDLIKNKNPNALVVVDNTFLSPYFQKPLDLGADLVVHSVTKYLNGHCDVVMGVVVGRNDQLEEKLSFLQNGMGGVPGPMDSFLALRGLKTLHLRMERHQENAMKVVEFLEKHERVEKLVYPGLPSHPQHHIAKKQMTGFGGMITFWLKGGLSETRRFLESLQVFTLAESLGGVESLVNHPALMTHASLPPENKLKLNIKENMIRLSVGIEDPEDLIEDLKNAFNAKDK